MAEESEAVAAFRRRVSDWQMHKLASVFVDNPSVKPAVAPGHGEQPRYFRYTDSKGIRAGERYKRQGKLQEMYTQLVPNQKWLARLLADAGEKEIFEASDSQASYGSNYTSYAMRLNTHVQFDKQLQAKNSGEKCAKSSKS